jgi:hypothetical protein
VQFQLLTSTNEHFSRTVLVLPKYFPLFLMTLICTFCVVGFTIISSSEPAVLSSGHFFASVNGVEPPLYGLPTEAAYKPSTPGRSR